jgi:hypothetical protein
MRLLLPILALFVSSLPSTREAATPAADASSGLPLGRIEIELGVTVKQHPRSVNLREVCRTGRDVDACTDFPREIVGCKCEQAGDWWVLVGVAEIDAITHLKPGRPIERLLLHERAHLDDLENGLRSHLAGLETMRFESREACAIYTGVVNSSQYLRIVMNELRVASNERYGCDGRQRARAAFRARREEKAALARLAEEEAGVTVASPALARQAEREDVALADSQPLPAGTSTAGLEEPSPPATVPLEAGGQSAPLFDD